MNISMRFRLGIVLALAAVVAGCEGPCTPIESINGPSLSANGVDLSTYVAVGTSLTAGYMSGGVVDRHQVRSFPAIFAQQIGMTVQSDGKGSFSQPVVDGDGLDTLFRITSYNPLRLSRSGRQEGTPVNLGQTTAYHHLGMQGSVLFDFLNPARYGSLSAFPKLGQSKTYSVTDYVLRGRGTVFSEAMSLNPTIMSLEYGANEVLGFATAGTNPPANTGANHAALMTASLNAIRGASPGTRVAVFNVPDVTAIPFFTTIPPFVEVGGAQVPLTGTNGPLAANDLVTLPAATLLATGFGTVAKPLPEAVILRATEVADTRAQIAQMNAVVDSVALRPNVAKVDLHRLLEDISTQGVTIGGSHYTAKYISGGIFGLDGVHPNDLGYALMANELIQSVNGKFGCLIPTVNPAQYGTVTPSRLQPAGIAPYPSDLGGLEQSLLQVFPPPR